MTHYPPHLPSRCQIGLIYGDKRPSGILRARLMRPPLLGNTRPCGSVIIAADRFRIPAAARTSTSE